MGEDKRVTIEQVIERFRGFAPDEYPRTEALLAELARLRAVARAAREYAAPDKVWHVPDSAYGRLIHAVRALEVNDSQVTTTLD